MERILKRLYLKDKLTVHQLDKAVQKGIITQEECEEIKIEK